MEQALQLLSAENWTVVTVGGSEEKPRLDCLLLTLLDGGVTQRVWLLGIPNSIIVLQMDPLAEI